MQSHVTIFHFIITGKSASRAHIAIASRCITYFVNTLGSGSFSVYVGFAQGFAIAAPLRGCFTGYNTATKRDVRLCGIAWLHPEIQFLHANRIVYPY